MVLKVPAAGSRTRSRSNGFAGRKGGLSLRTIALIGLPLTLGGVMLAMARPNGAQDRPGGSPHAVKPANAVKKAVAGSRDTSATKLDALAGNVADERPPLNYYTKEVRSTMFSAPQPPPPVPVAPPKPVKLPPPVKVIVPPANPFASWSYTGTVHMGEQIMALLENSQTKDGQYLKIGDAFQGAEVANITDQMVTLTQAGKPYQFAKSDNIVITPLNAVPGGNNGQPQPGGQPPMPGPPGAVTNADGSMTMPNGFVVTPDMIARRQQRRANGGGRRGGGGGGFGGGGGGGGFGGGPGGGPGGG